MADDCKSHDRPVHIFSAFPKKIIGALRVTFIPFLLIRSQPIGSSSSLAAVDDRYDPRDYALRK